MWERREPQLLTMGEFSRIHDDGDDDDNAENEANYDENRIVFYQLMYFPLDILK